jgi:hypothetical protein
LVGPLTVAVNVNLSCSAIVAVVGVICTVIPHVIVTVAVAKAVVSTVLVATTRIGFVDGTAEGAV